ncbi:unnamed protein product [Dibothriocephalus latus]|uniref:Uncharacterized protein n=1 Tax=Dibothriocephalus latus TaxID=60516 RepID=A0A3P6TG22_DIBLA|nr:unnamed protein product [Dibothriocephalus latus]
MSEDYRYQLQLQNGDAHIEFNSAIFSMALISIDDIFVGMGSEQLYTYGFPLLDRSVGNQLPTEQQRATMGKEAKAKPGFRASGRYSLSGKH